MHKGLLLLLAAALPQPAAAERAVRAQFLVSLQVADICSATTVPAQASASVRCTRQVPYLVQAAGDAPHPAERSPQVLQDGAVVTIVY